VSALTVPGDCNIAALAPADGADDNEGLDGKEEEEEDGDAI